MSVDSDLVKEAQAGCEESFRSLIGKVERRLYYVGYSMVGNQHDADDLWQETIIRAWRYLPRLRDRQKFSPWLAKILMGEAKRLLSRKRRIPVAADVGAYESEQDNADLYLQVHESLRQISQLQREAVVLRFWADLSLQEIAETLGVPLSTAKTRLYQGMAALEQVLGKEVQVGGR